MGSKCDDCPWIKEYIDLGGCPACKASKLLMNTNTHIATCDVCGMTFGIPMAVERLCWGDIESKQFTISICTDLDKQQLLDVAKMIDYTATQVYCLFKNNYPVVLENIPMHLAYRIRAYFRSLGREVTIIPALDDYHLFEECWDI